jgi:hypothetical protein
VRFADTNRAVSDLVVLRLPSAPYIESRAVLVDPEGQRAQAGLEGHLRVPRVVLQRRALPEDGMTGAAEIRPTMCRTVRQIARDAPPEEVCRPDSYLFHMLTAFVLYPAAQDT